VGDRRRPGDDYTFLAVVTYRNGGRRRVAAHFDVKSTALLLAEPRTRVLLAIAAMGSL
jgi:hypothetical protein